MADFRQIPSGTQSLTFQYDNELPSLPLPSLSHTLNRYLDSVHPFVNDEEYSHTERLVEIFANGQGKELQNLLSTRASLSRNWLEEWWENYAYLENRAPLLPLSSMIGVAAMEEFGWKPCLGTLIKRCALYLYYAVEIWELLRAQKLMPGQSADGKTKFSMSQFRRLYNCTRTPLPNRDRLDVFFKPESEGPCPSHVIVQCNGHIYMMDAVDAVTGISLSSPEWELQLQIIFTDAHANPGPGLGRLTCDSRDIWAENRAYLQRLSAQNSHFLDYIDTAMFVICLDSDTPGNAGELSRSMLCGDYANRWADKSLNLVFFENGMMGGISEHTAFDGLVSVTTMMYIFSKLQEIGGVYRGSNRIRPLKTPKKLDFTLDEKIRNELDTCDARQNPTKSSVLMIREKFSSFGKKAIVKYRIHPDTFVQLALQLSYYSLHRKLAPCYETATTRAYYNGRTETHRPCTTQVAQWVYAMDNPIVKPEEKVRLMKVAAQRNDQLMKEARENRGCDRHLFGLYCTAIEAGLPIPEIFNDPAYVKSGGGGNFVLSTSLVGFFPTGGGVSAMTQDGYGIFYNIRPDSIFFTLSTYREGETSSTNKYFQRLSNKLNEMLDLLESTHDQNDKQSKL